MHDPGLTSGSINKSSPSHLGRGYRCASR